MHCFVPAERGDVVTFSPWAEEQLTYALMEDTPRETGYAIWCL